MNAVHCGLHQQQSSL